MTMRVVQWATGKLGTEILQEAIGRPDFEVVGAYVYSPEKAGLDIGTIAGVDEIGVTATNDKAAIMALEADRVVHAPQLQDTMVEHDADVIALLESGKNVTSIMGYHNPRGLDPEVAESA